MDSEKLHDYIRQVMLDSGATPKAAFRGATKIMRAVRKHTAPAESFDLAAKPKLALPDKAPEIYKGNQGGKESGENIVDFMRRVWMPWIEAGVLTRPALRKLDPKADKGINNWKTTKEWPEDLKIPTIKEITDGIIDTAQIKGVEMMPLIKASSAIKMREHRKTKSPRKP